MISVVVYGRNDAHGYNLHKRAALSLNAVAEILTSDEDEIIFVDFNSPDEIPTFPESIADTLTPRTRKRLRVIRVRPEFHRQFVGKTPLVALEPQSRNIAIRRSNPANPWILSTNTDMILVPKGPDLSLTDIAGELGDGFYHLPRFEVPEGFWEQLDRMDPVRAIERMRRWGTRFHFNEIVLSGREGLYEAPGDFQLFRREDLFSIAGFDERMILGWHVDSNIARRMHLLYGRVDSAFEHLAAYHCGHTRQATIMHRADRTENSLSEYVDAIEDAVAWWQTASWGAPELEFEEIRLGAESVAVHLDAMLAAVPQEGPAYTEADIGPDAWTKVDYEADHVLPHLCDLLYHLPEGERILISTSDTALIAGIGRFLGASRPGTEIILASDHELLRPDDLPGSGSCRWMPFAEALETASCLVIVNPGPGIDAARSRDLQWFAQVVLDTVIDAERHRPPASRRRVIVVNALGHPIQNTVHASMSYTLMPSSLRLRHGYVIDPPRDRGLAESAGEAEREYYNRLGRFRAFAPDERELVAKALQLDGRGNPVLAGWERLAPEIVALGEVPTATSALGFDETTVGYMVKAAGAVIEAAATRCFVNPVKVPARLGVSTRLCSGADWEDPEWQAMLRRYWADEEYTLTMRRRWLWERIAVVIELRQRLDPLTRPWVLLVSEQPDFVASFLAELGYRLAYVTAGELLGEASGRPDWTAETAPRLHAQHADVWHLGDIEEARLRLPAFAGVVLTQNCLFRGSERHTDAMLTALAGMIAVEAVVVAAAEVHLNDRNYSGALTYTEWLCLFERDGLLGSRGFRSAGAFDPAIPLDTAIRYAFEDQPQETISGLSFGYGDAFVTVALIGAVWADRAAALRSRPVPRSDIDVAGIVSKIIDQDPAPAGEDRTVALPPRAPEPTPLLDTELVARGSRVLAEAKAFADLSSAGPTSLARGLKLKGSPARQRGAVLVEHDGDGQLFVTAAVDGGSRRALKIALSIPELDADTEARAVFVGRGGKSLKAAVETFDGGMSIGIAARRALGRGVVAIRVSCTAGAIGKFVAVPASSLAVAIEA